jgi:hypothetical protein
MPERAWCVLCPDESTKSEPVGGSLDALFSEAATVLPDYTNFLPTETSVLNRHAEEGVLILLVVGGEGVLVEQDQFRIIRARFREVRELFSDVRDQAGLSFHSLVVGDHARRIVDSGCVGIPQIEDMLHRRFKRG